MLLLDRRLFVAAGAGANIALACDIIFAARSAKFIQSFANIGLIPDSGGTWVLPRLAGQARALGLALTGEPLPAPLLHSTASRAPSRFSSANVSITFGNSTLPSAIWSR